MTSSSPSVPAVAGAIDPQSGESEKYPDHIQHHVEDAERSIQPTERFQEAASGETKPVWKDFGAFSTDSWTIEIASLATSIALLIGLAILFRIWDGKSTAKWTAVLSFTTVVAIMSKASQVTLMIPVTSSMSQLGWMHFRQPGAVIDFQRFDQATRSSWGTLRLLFSAPSWWAMLSLLVVVPGLAYEAAAQQCLGTVPPAEIPILAQIVSLDIFASSGGVVSDGLKSAAMTAMTAKGRYFNEGVPPAAMIPGGHARTEIVLPQTLFYTCATPSCMPAPYATLSFCSTCQDITDELSIASSGFVQLSSGGGLNSSDHVLMIKSHPIHYDYSDSGKGKLTLANFSLIEYFPQAPPIIVQVVQFAAQRCTINLCTNIYQLDVSQGSTGASGATEILLASVTQASGGARPGWTVPVPAGTLLNFPNGKVKKWQNNLLSDTSGYSNDPGYDTDTDDYRIDNSSLVFISDYFASLFDGQSSQTSEDGVFIVDALNYAQRPAGTGFWDTFAYTLTTYGYTDHEQITNQVNGVVSNIASSMGNWARDYYATNAAVTFGGLLENTYHIRWAWLALPAMIELLAVLLLLLTILETRKQKFPVWKTSCITVMFRGITQPERAAGLYSEKVSTMEDVAAKKRVKLALTSGGYRLVDAETETRHSD